VAEPANVGLVPRVSGLSPERGAPRWSPQCRRRVPCEDQFIGRKRVAPVGISRIGAVSARPPEQRAICGHRLARASRRLMSILSMVPKIMASPAQLVRSVTEFD
jgi:hypothetical protein